MRARLIGVVLLATGCTFGGGPLVAVGRRGVTVGAQGGGGPGDGDGDSSGGIRLDLGLGYGRKRYGFAAGTIFIEEHGGDGDRRAGYGGSLSLGGGGGSGLVLALAGHAGSFTPVHCSGSNAWIISLGVRTAADELEVFVWPQYLHWIGFSCD